MSVIIQITNTTINYVAIGLMIFIILFSVGMVVFFLLSRKRITLADLDVRDIKIKAQEDVLAATLLTQDRERTRIARELHDEISAKLNVISLNASLLNDKTLEHQDRELLLARIQTATRKTLENTRRLAHDLLPPVLEKFGLGQAITEFVDSIHNGQLLITYTCDWDEETLTTEDQLHTYRIVQELFNNSIKYSEATQIELSLITAVNRRMTYRDNGIGFQETGSVGLGTSNINSRVFILGGIMTLETSINNGVFYIFDFQTNAPMTYD
jgi:signal transduction histidine kinase